MKKNRNYLLIGVLTVASVKCLASPAISKQPTDQFVSLGANVKFQVTATGTAPLSYQWQRDDAQVGGAIGASLVITNVSSAAAGSYAVVVTDPSGSVTSRVAKLDVDLTFTKITAGPIVTERSSFLGSAWGDFDGDGYIDLATVAASLGTTPFEAVHLYKNNGPGTNGFTFTKVTTGAIATNLVNGLGMAWADYDNDGRLDLFVVNSGTRNFLFRNLGDGAFLKMTNAPFSTDRSLGDNGAWADYNRDGYLDLFVTNWDENRTLRNYFYQNNGDGTFRKLTTNDVGSFLAEGGIMASASWADYDNDGYPDLFVTRPLNNDASLLYRNNGKGGFQKMTKEQVGEIVNDGNQGTLGGSSGAAWGDYDNDGDLDLFVPVGGEARLAASNFLWRNNGNGTFSKMSTKEVGTIVGEPGASTSAAWADYDNDGWLDLFVTRPGPMGRGEDNLLYRNKGDGTFAKVTAGSPVHDGVSEWGASWGDFDNDGFMDLLVADGLNPFANSQQTNALYRNNGNANHWLKLILKGTVSNRSAIGAKVRVKTTSGGKTFWQLREVSGSGNRYNFQDMRPNFGLGEATFIEIVRIEWPSGTVQELRDVAANQLLTITEPPRLETVKVVSGNAELQVKSWPGFVYGIQASEDLNTWTSLGLQTNAAGMLRIADPDGLTSAKRFYRLKTQ